ncbi:MAG: hypothetical protein GY794_12495 [bacterium]|nr:hypothetical protein [bacterium]
MFRTRINKMVGLSLAICMMAGLLLASGCSKGTGLRPTLLFNLPDTCNTPDGVTLDEKTGDIYLCCPNFKLRNGKNEAQKYPAVIMKIDKNNKLTKFCDLPKHPLTKQVGPMGLDIGPDGNLYVADNQYFWSKDYASRLLRVNIKNGKAVGVDVVVEGTKLSNAVICRGNYVYVSDTFFDVKDKPGISGIWRFSMNELKSGKPVKLNTKAFDPHTIGKTDPHIIATFQTFANHRGDTAGADGLTFDKEGNLYCGNFGDGVISKITFDAKGNVASNKILIKTDKMPSADGMFYDAKRDLIYIADSERNAVRSFKTDGTDLTTVWENDATATGAKGLIDQPCEVLVRGDTLFVICFDIPFPGLLNQNMDKFHTISTIQLDKK